MTLEQAKRLSKTGISGTGAGTFNIEQANMGSLARLADATELMASNYLQLQRDLKYMTEDRDRYRSWYYNQSKMISSLRGVITRMKNKAKKQ